MLFNSLSSDKFKSSFKPEFIEKVRKNKELREKEQEIYREQLKPENLVYSDKTKHGL
ncbi:hypothetical protein KBB68_03515 [Candidatus Babeliales bacterium]|nr:hypothetical protein [Candidatus Babeliales bacterium]